MENTGIAILIASFLCGMIGSALAKSAKKKNSYPLLIISSVLAAATLVGIIASAVMLLFL